MICVFSLKNDKTNKQQAPWIQITSSQIGSLSEQQHLEPGMNNSGIFISDPGVPNLDVYFYALKNEIKANIKHPPTHTHTHNYI